jgi:archaellum component FlaC
VSEDGEEITDLFRQMLANKERVQKQMEEQKAFWITSAHMEPKAHIQPHIPFDPVTSAIQEAIQDMAHALRRLEERIKSLESQVPHMERYPIE